MSANHFACALYPLVLHECTCQRRTTCLHLHSLSSQLSRTDTQADTTTPHSAPPPSTLSPNPTAPPPPPNTHPPLKRMRPSGVRLACVIMPLYSTVSTSSAGASSPSSISPLSVTVPAGRFGALRAPAPPPPPPPPLGAACVFLARGCFLCCWGAGWREGRRERERGESETR